MICGGITELEESIHTPMTHKATKMTIVMVDAYDDVEVRLLPRPFPKAMFPVLRKQGRKKKKNEGVKWELKEVEIEEKEEKERL